MEEKRTGGIVTAVTLAIAAAFAAIMLLFLFQSKSIAARFAERETDLVASNISANLVAFVSDQSVLASSTLMDEELARALAAEVSDTNAPTVANNLAPVFSRLEVANNGSLSFVISSASSTIYRSNGTWEHLATHPEDVAWIESVCGQDKDVSSSTYRVRFTWGTEGLETRILSGRPLVINDEVVGVVGVSVPGSVVGEAMEQFLGEQAAEEHAVCFSPDGKVEFDSRDELKVDSDVYASYPISEAELDGLAESASAHSQVWTGLDGLMPRGQLLYDVRYCKDFNSYLLVENTAGTVFESMRTRSTTLILALSVVMVLLMLLVITSVRWYRGRLIKIATTDELTGLANRKSFVASYAERAQRGGDPATLALIDVDFFKRINDAYGHAAGDEALASVAANVATMAGPGGLAGRWGGDEFIAVIDATGDEALARIHHMIDAVRDTRFDEGFSVTVSMGSTIVDWQSPLERMVEQADDALYQTKAGGRGFHMPYVSGVTPHVAGDHISLGKGAAGQTSSQVDRPAVAVSEDVAPRAHRLLDLMVESLLEAVNKMIPFVAGGGILIAIAFLIDGASVDVNSLTAEARANFGSITPIAAGLKDVGSAAFNFMLPIFAAFFARGLAGDEAFMAGFAGGFLASQGSAGFTGAIAAALVAAAVVRLMNGFVDEMPVSLKRVAPVLLYPVFSLLIMYLLMTFVIDPVASAFDRLLTSLLVSLEGGSRIVLGMACGAMMATDMGGPINKAAYHFGTAAIASGSPDIMASVMVGGMVPPCGIALCMLVFRSRFSEAERDQTAATLMMGLSFITEGAIPFVLTDVARVIASCMVGAGAAGALSMAFGCTLMAPHGGIFVFPVVGNAGMYLVALGAGSLITALVLGLLKPAKKTK